jgi:ABC-type transport system involved in cytochrome bd biosynthesis fused ATPase/permease subunit
MISLIKILIKIKPKFLAFLILATAFLLVIEISGVVSLSLFIDFLINKESNNNFGFVSILEIFNINRSLLSISLLVVSISVIRNFYFAFYIYLKAKFSHSTSEVIANKIISFFLGRKGFLNDKFSPSYLQHLTVNQSYEICSATLIGIIDLISSILIILGICVFLATVNPIIFISVLLIIATLYLIIIFFLNNFIKKTGKDKFHTTKNIAKLTLEIYSNLKEIKILKLDNFFKDSFKKQYFAFNKNRLISKIIGRYPRLLIETVLIITIVGSLNYFIILEMDIIISTVAIFVVGFYRVLPYADTIFTSWTNFKISEDLLKFLLKNKLLDEKISISKSKLTEIKTFKSLQIENGLYRNGSKYLFSKLNLIVKSCDKFFITGPSGSGKTTLINIICGITKLQKGNYKINSKNTFEIENINSLFTICSQSPIILNRSIKDNIILNKKFDKKNFDAVIKIVDLNKILIRGRNISSKISPDTLNFSGGEKQRISIARALYHMKPILIMDEATNGLDEISELKIIKQIIKTYKNNTIIFISHNQSLKNNFSKTLFLK